MINKHVNNKNPHKACTRLCAENEESHKARTRLFPNKSLVPGLVHHKAQRTRLSLVVHKASAQDHKPRRDPSRPALITNPWFWGPGR